MTPQQIIDELNKIPHDIYSIDLELSQSSAHLAELKDSLELAELNAELGVQWPDKSNEETRKRLKTQAIATSPDVRQIKKLILDEQLKQSEREAAHSMALRQFQAAMSVSDLTAAQLNLLAAKVERGLTHGQH